jgi:hypothetical protein
MAKPEHSTPEITLLRNNVRRAQEKGKVTGETLADAVEFVLHKDRDVPPQPKTHTWLIPLLKAAVAANVPRAGEALAYTTGGGGGGGGAVAPPPPPPLPASPVLSSAALPAPPPPPPSGPAAQSLHVGQQNGPSHNAGTQAASPAQGGAEADESQSTGWRTHLSNEASRLTTLLYGCRASLPPLVQALLDQLWEREETVFCTDKDNGERVELVRRGSVAFAQTVSTTLDARIRTYAAQFLGGFAGVADLGGAPAGAASASAAGSTGGAGGAGGGAGGAGSAGGAGGTGGTGGTGGAAGGTGFEEHFRKAVMDAALRLAGQSFVPADKYGEVRGLVRNDVDDLLTAWKRVIFYWPDKNRPSNSPTGEAAAGRSVLLALSGGGSGSVIGSPRPASAHS